MSKPWRILVLSEDVLHIAVGPKQEWACGKGSGGEPTESHNDALCFACNATESRSRNRWRVGEPELGE